MASKYKAIKTVVDGITFDSKREVEHYLQFRALERSGAIQKLELQVPYTIHHAVQEGTGSREIKPVCKYVADFVVTEKDGTVRVYDSKGVRTPVYKLKKKFVEAEYGIRIVEI